MKKLVLNQEHIAGMGLAELHFVETFYAEALLASRSKTFTTQDPDCTATFVTADSRIHLQLGRYTDRSLKGLAQLLRHEMICDGNVVETMMTMSLDMPQGTDDKKSRSDDLLITASLAEDGEAFFHLAIA